MCNRFAIYTDLFTFIINYQYLKNFHEKCSLIYLANYIKLLRTAAFNFCILIIILGDIQNCMPPILVPSSAKRIATQILATVRLSGRKVFILRVFVYDIIRPTKELLVQT